MKIALLSNYNIDPIVRMLRKNADVFENQGYGNVLGNMLNADSAFNRYAPDVCFILTDISALTCDCDSEDGYHRIIDDWFDTLDACIRKDRKFFVSDCDFRMPFHNTGLMAAPRLKVEAYWYEKLCNLADKHRNAHIFPYKDLVMKFGRSCCYTQKMWYLGSIIHTPTAQKEIAAAVAKYARRVTETPCKALLLDLDNTLWGGIVGEDGLDGILLSDDHVGAIYKDLQRVIKRIKERGIVLAIVSKNNEADAMEVIEHHPHMILKKDDFAITKINWEDKSHNIAQIARELNIGLDSMVFVDDNPAEREAISSLLPQVIVPEFPEDVEVLPEFIAEIYEQFFFKIFLTEEDKKKTEQYLSNASRAQLERSSGDYAGFLKQLRITVRTLPLNDGNIDRCVQLLNKTNQFNLTTRRHDLSAVARMQNDAACLFYLFSAADKFGDYGIISVIIVTLIGKPRIDSFVMSCRVMGKLVENYILNCVENDLREKGYVCLEAEYIPSNKNVPVEFLFDKLGYETIRQDGQRKIYRLELEKAGTHEHYIISEDN